MKLSICLTIIVLSMFSAMIVMVHNASANEIEYNGTGSLFYSAPTSTDTYQFNASPSYNADGHSATTFFEITTSTDFQFCGVTFHLKKFANPTPPTEDFYLYLVKTSSSTTPDFLSGSWYLLEIYDHEEFTNDIYYDASVELEFCLPVFSSSTTDHYWIAFATENYYYEDANEPRGAWQIKAYKPIYDDYANYVQYSTHDGDSNVVELSTWQTKTPYIDIYALSADGLTVEESDPIDETEETEQTLTASLVMNDIKYKMPWGYFFLVKDSFDDLDTATTTMPDLELSFDFMGMSTGTLDLNYETSTFIATNTLQEFSDTWLVRLAWVIMVAYFVVIVIYKLKPLE